MKFRFAQLVMIGAGVAALAMSACSDDDSNGTPGTSGSGGAGGHADGEVGRALPGGRQRPAALLLQRQVVLVAPAALVRRRDDAEEALRAPASGVSGRNKTRGLTEPSQTCA